MERCSPHVSLIRLQVSDYYTRLGNKSLLAKRLQPVNLDRFNPILVDLIQPFDTYKRCGSQPLNRASVIRLSFKSVDRSIECRRAIAQWPIEVERGVAERAEA